jgi:hypothetical protein
MTPHAVAWGADVASAATVDILFNALIGDWRSIAPSACGSRNCGGCRHLPHAGLTVSAIIDALWLAHLSADRTIPPTVQARTLVKRLTNLCHECGVNLMSTCFFVPALSIHKDSFCGRRH